MENTVSHEIAEVSMGRPLVVILGAGASRAAFPHGEQAGRRLPVMADFLQIVPVSEIVSAGGMPVQALNFEDIYSKLAGDPTADKVCAALVNKKGQTPYLICQTCSVREAYPGTAGRVKQRLRPTPGGDARAGNKAWKLPRCLSAK